MKKIIIGTALATCFLSACNTNSNTTLKGKDSSTASLEKNKQTALNSVEAYSKKDIAGILKDCSSDFVDYGTGEGKPMKNQDSIRTMMKSFFAAFPDYKGENFKAVAEGDTVIVTANWSGTFKNAFMNIKPTGKSFKAPDADIFTFNDAGKITSHKGVQSEGTFFYQLGISMPAKKK
ncbi:ester cyclase [Mucilaginibacter arboris]|uniref:Ester cyclase n=1 Tax=Mucilaginibacter arboris TaxID=2682090 RepID=A0A7K1T1H9_9SPHI|nr:ester cyclase [Mucilaginibacter arboris]MVN23409.1 hypothetical protein [Mucilaginibacter arboris]